MRQRVRAAGQSLAGDGMLLRLRNASIALIAAITAVGLGLTLFIAQLGFPGVFSSPIPANPSRAGTVQDAIAVARSPAAVTPRPTLGAPSKAGVAGHAGRPPGRSGGGNGGGSRSGHGDGIGGSHQVAVSPGAAEHPAAAQPIASIPASTPPAPAATPAPTPSNPASPGPTAAAGSPSKSGFDGQSKGAPGTTTSNGPSTAKVGNDGGGKAKGPQTAKADGQTAASRGKSNDTSAEKASKDQNAAAAPKPAAAPSEPSGPESVSPAAAKEAADAGR